MTHRQPGHFYTGATQMRPRAGGQKTVLSSRSPDRGDVSQQTGCLTGPVFILPSKRQSFQYPSAQDADQTGTSGHLIGK
jgi:hypothetical protein